MYIYFVLQFIICSVLVSVTSAKWRWLDYRLTFFVYLLFWPNFVYPFAPLGIMRSRLKSLGIILRRCSQTSAKWRWLDYRLQFFVYPLSALVGHSWGIFETETLLSFRSCWYYMYIYIYFNLGAYKWQWLYYRMQFFFPSESIVLWEHYRLWGV